jgi:hypothetical protein
MTQKRLKVRSNQTASTQMSDTATAVGLAYDDDIVTLRFMETLKWGRPVRQVKLDRNLAEQLNRLLTDELEDAPSF